MEAELAGAVLRIDVVAERVGAEGVDRIGEGDVVHVRDAVGVRHPDVARPVASLVQHQVVPEGADVVDQRVGPMRDDLAPVWVRRADDRSLHHAEVGRLVVGPDHEAVALVIGVILDVTPARFDHLEGAARIVGRQVAHLTVIVAGDGQQQAAAAARPGDELIAVLVRLVMDLGGLVRGLPDHVPKDLVGAVGVVEGSVEQRAAVAGPRRRAGDPANSVGHHLPGL